MTVVTFMSRGRSSIGLQRNRSLIQGAAGDHCNRFGRVAGPLSTSTRKRNSSCCTCGLCAALDPRLWSNIPTWCADDPRLKREEARREDAQRISSRERMD